MNMNKPYGFTEETRVMSKENEVILSNRFTGKWAKVSGESYLFLMDYVDNKITLQDLHNQITDICELDFMVSLLNAMENLKLIKPLNTKLKYKRTISVSFSITHKCNLKCFHCSYSAVDLTDKSEEMDTVQTIHTLDNIIRCDPHSIVITGGEPLIRRDFVEISEYLGKHYKGSKALMTNATLINDNNIDSIVRNYTNIDISMDGVDEETCASIRGNGVYESVVKAIHELQLRGMERISLSMVLTGNNIHLKDQFMFLCMELNVKPLPRQFIAMGRGKDNFEYLNKSEAKEHKVVVYAVENVNRLELKTCCCTAGIGEVFIEPNGDIYPCPLLLDNQFYIGNIFEDHIDLVRYFEADEYIKTESFKHLDLLDPSKHERCKECNVNQFCITCPAELNAYYNDEIYWNPYCRYHKDPFEKIVWGGI